MGKVTALGCLILLGICTAWLRAQDTAPLVDNAKPVAVESAVPAQSASTDSTATLPEQPDPELEFLERERAPQATSQAPDASASTAEATPVAGRQVSEVKPSAANIRDRYQGKTNPDLRLDAVVQLGETLTYLGKWNGIPSGTISLRVWPTKRRVRDRQAMLFELHTESNDFLSMFYEVNSTLKSYADVESGRSYLFRRSLREGRYRANDRLQFDYDNRDDEGLVTPVSRFARIRPDHVTPKEPSPIPGNLQDPLSIVYYLRHFDFSGVGTSHTILMGTRKNTSLVQLTTIAEERIHIPQLGTFETSVVEPKGDENADPDSLAKTKGYARVWLEKHTRIPLMATVSIPIGKASASLISAENCVLDKFRLAPPTETTQQTPASDAASPAAKPDTAPAPSPEDLIE